MALPNVGGSGNAHDLQAIVGVKPDLVVAGAINTREQVDSLTNLGLEVLYLSALDPHLAGLRGREAMAEPHRVGPGGPRTGRGPRWASSPRGFAAPNPRGAAPRVSVMA